MKKMEIAGTGRFVGSLAVEAIATRGLGAAYPFVKSYNTDELRALYSGAHTYTKELAARMPEGGEALLEALLTEARAIAAAQPGNEAQTATAAMLITGAVLSITLRGLEVSR